MIKERKTDRVAEVTALGLGKHLNEVDPEHLSVFVKASTSR